MSARDLRRAVTIELVIDPALIPRIEDDSLADAALQGLYQFNPWRLRLVPCKGGVALRMFPPQTVVHKSPESLAAALGDKALDCAIRAGECVGTATNRYHEDRMWFYLLAAHAVREDPRILRMWGLS